MQIITGIAILISALAQVNHLTFYHAQFAVQFWWVTLNSFWISRIDYSRSTPDMASYRASTRRLAIFVSLGLSMAMQAIVAFREHSRWDPTVPGRCYMVDGVGTSFAQNLFWLAGSALYFVVMSLSLFSASRRWWDRCVNSQVTPSLDTMRGWAAGSWCSARSYASSASPRLPKLIFLYLKTASYGVAWLTWWFMVLFLSIWCAGNSAPAVELVVYSVFAGFLSWWILYLKVQNVTLIRGDETRWTYGQTLSLLLLVFIAFSAVDAWAEVKREAVSRGRKRDERNEKALRASIVGHGVEA
jgi:hypothetical protein